MSMITQTDILTILTLIAPSEYVEYKKEDQNEFQINKTIQEQARILMTCKSIYSQRLQRLAILKKTYEENCKNAESVHNSLSDEKFPLHYLLRMQNLSQFKVLLRTVSDVNAPNQRGITILHQASQLNLKEFVNAILLHPDVDVMIKTPKSLKTAIDLTTDQEIKNALSRHPSNKVYSTIKVVASLTTELNFGCSMKLGTTFSQSTSSPS